MKPETEFLKTAVPPLLEWYRIHRRELPWRGTHDPYRVLVSEIMLQQTRVEAVKGYYAAFLEKFPDAAALARAADDEVLKAWQGLGYYSRARNLQLAAKRIAEEGFPKTYEGVRALPGVGDYTAGAVCSIAYDLPCPAVDGNVLRILTRLLADGRNIGEGGVRADFSARLKEVYPPEAGDFCQALMELGAIVCLPNGAPLCGECPWPGLCRAHLAGEEEKYPVRGEKKGRKIVELNVFVLKCGQKYALRKRGKGLLAGLWEFPNEPAETVPALPSCPPVGKVSPQGAEAIPTLPNCLPLDKVSSQGASILSPSSDGASVLSPSSDGASILSPSSDGASILSPSSEGGRGVGVTPEIGKTLSKKTAKHIFTHVEWHMTGYLIEAETEAPQYVWATAEEIGQTYAVPSAFKAFLEWVK